jgi:hypothetical protein
MVNLKASAGIRCLKASNHDRRERWPRRSPSVRWSISPAPGTLYLEPPFN